MLLGCIGDDFTGSSDLANTLTRAGMRTTQYVGIPDAPAEPGVDAGVVALKTRSIPAQDAVAQSLAALEWLRAQGCRQFLFKYCSTFDSTPGGNIGPVAEALASTLNARKVIVCPAFPATGRSVYMGHLFVDGHLLNESGMEAHPLTPMTDPDLRRWLARQTSGAVGHIDARTVQAGVEAVRAALDTEDGKGNRLIIADAIRDEDLRMLGRAARDLPLITGGSGIAMGLPENFRAAGLLEGHSQEWRGEPGPVAILSGSCSRATREQVEVHMARHPAREIAIEAVMAGAETAAMLADWLIDQEGVPLIYSSAHPEPVAALQEKFGRSTLSGALDRLFAETARLLVDRGITRLIVAGGETSGAVTSALDATSLEIGPEIAPGVPALRAGPKLVLALKSGNFGGPDFFLRAAHVLEGKAHV